MTISKEFEEFMASKYAEAEEYSAGVTAGEQEIAEEAWRTALTCAIMAMPGGSSVDPQWVCDELRRLGGTYGDPMNDVAFAELVPGDA